MGPRRLFATVGLSLATASFSVIAADYFIQLRTVQTSLLLGEADGLRPFRSTTPNGVFIAIEELGFLAIVWLTLLVAGVLLACYRRSSSRGRRARRTIEYRRPILLACKGSRKMNCDNNRTRQGGGR